MRKRGGEPRPCAKGRSARWKPLLVALLSAFATMTADAACVSLLISSTGIAFGEVALSGAKASGTVTLSCTGAGATSYTVALSTGGSGSYSGRRMSSGPNTLFYNLYADAALTKVWGDGTGGSTVVSGILALQASHPSTSISHTIYGRIPAKRLPAPGTYADTITITTAF